MPQNGPGGLRERFGAYCRSCRRPVLWATSGDDERMPVDPDPATNGNVMLAVERGRLIAGVLSIKDARRRRATGQPLHLAHFATCPNANQHRKRTR